LLPRRGAHLCLPPKIRAALFYARNRIELTAALTRARSNGRDSIRSQGMNKMYLDRRHFLMTSAAFAGAAALPRLAFADFAPQAGAWRSFQIATRLEVTPDAGAKTQAWVPLPSVNEAEWFKSSESTWTTNGHAEIATDAKSGARMLHVEWASTEKAPVVEVLSAVSTRDRASDPKQPGSATLAATDRKRYTEGTELIPIDGIVKEMSDKIVAGAKTDVDKARAIYEWIVDNTARDGKVRGCGIGDIRVMLKTGVLTGKCADLNALYVGLVRSQGIPARDVYGIRVAASKFGYKSLGAGSEVITKAQHCRAETFIAGHGWIATDPADVRKVVLEEPPTNLALNDPKVAAARQGLFGSWEGNWLAYNFAHDVALPGSSGPKLGFLMYPQAECGPTRLDCLDPDSFKYTIKAKELTAA
jgi:transglutaminase-like putative cysteine protease